ncbi:MAG: flagellar hook-length control protein FliK [Acidobacteriota bacterium]
MFFNPLFLQVVNNQETPLLNKAQKLTGPSYLFSDIIKVQLDKNETGSLLSPGKETAAENNLLSSIVSALSSQSAQLPLAQVQNASGINVNPALDIKGLNPSALLQLMDKESSEEKASTDGEDINSLLVGNSELFNFINELLTNHQLDGKISIVNAADESAESKDTAISPTNALPLENLTASEVLNLLKNGKTIAVENSAFQSNNGLLITMEELSAEAAKTQAGGGVLNASPQEDTLPKTMNTTSTQTLAEMIAAQNAGAQDADPQASGPLYKLKFSLVSNQEDSGSLMGIEKPIIKLPFSNNLNASTNTEPVNDGLNALSNVPPVTGMKAEGENLSIKPEKGNPQIGTGTVKSTASTQATPITSEGSKPEVGTPLIKNEADSSIAANDDPSTVNMVKTEDTAKEDSAEKDVVKDNISKEPGVKTGKFVNIERVKTDPGIQSNETKLPEQQKLELPDQEVTTKDLSASGSLHPEEMKNQKANESTDKKAESGIASKLQDATVLNHKEKDLKETSPQEKQQQQASSPSEIKTDAKDSAKGEMNSSSKEQNHQNPDGTASGEHLESKGKIQEEHPFTIGTQLKTGEDSFSVKRTIDSSPFGEAAKTVKAAEVMKEISKFIQQGDKNSIVLKIDPENLGTVKIALDLADKVVHANIEVENESARKLMENNLNQLYNSLNQSGIQLNSINISLAHQEQKQGKTPGQKRRNFMDEGNKDADDIGELRQKEMGYNTYDYLI